MKRIKEVIINILLGGFAVVLPLTILLFTIKWLFNTISSLINPLTLYVTKFLNYPQLFLDFIVITIILLSCFLIGLFMKTKLGFISFNLIETKILYRLVGYKFIKEVVNQFISNDKNKSFKEVAIVQIFDSKTLMIGFITEKHSFGYSVFVPTTPNPTSGFVYILSNEQVEILKDISIEEAMRSIISCGINSGKIIKSINKF